MSKIYLDHPNQAERPLYTEPKICKQCKSRTLLYSCLKGRTTRNVITGEYYLKGCGTMRHAEGPCGREGLLYEPKCFGQVLINLFKC